MKKLLFLSAICCVVFPLFAQEKIGIGTNNPQAQFHTTGDVMFSGIANDDNLTKLVVQNGPGMLAWRGAGTLSNYYWSLNGNGGTTGSDFLGTTNNMPLLIKTNNKTRVRIGTQDENAFTQGGMVEITVDSTKPNGCGLSIYRAANVNRWGSSVEFLMNNSVGQKKFYARINGGIESNIGGQENGIIGFEVSTNGQLGVNTQQTKMVITSQGYVGIGELFPNAQLHTNGSVRFTGITNDNNLSRILVQDNDGLLAWRDASTLSSNNTSGWSTTGNSGTSVSNNFIGTTDQNPFAIRVNNKERVRINTEAVNNITQGGVLDITVDSLKQNGCGVGIYRKGNVNGWGSSVEFQLNNSIGQKKFYARINGGIESNIAGAENGIIGFEVATNGQLGVNTQQVKMVILSSGNVGIGTLSPTAKLHNTGTVRFENLPSGSGTSLVIDQDGNVYKASTPPAPPRIGNTSDIINLQAEINQLKLEVEKLKTLIKK